MKMVLVVGDRSSLVILISRKQTYEVQVVLNGFRTVAEDYFSFDPSLETY